MRRVAVILGAPVDDITMDEAVDQIYAFVDTGRATGRSHQIATVNVDFIVQAARDRRLRQILQRTDMSIPDGMPLIWASRLFGTPLRQRVTGADLVPALAARGAASGAKMYLFGSAPGVADRAATQLEHQFPGIRVTGSAGAAVSASGEMDAAALSPIVEAQPDILCVALGNPKQEFWIQRYGAATGAAVCIGVGGTLDLLVGEKRRAPRWMQRGGLEWVFRAAQEPRRLVGRYAHDIAVFGPRLVRQAWIGRKRRGGSARHAVSQAGGALRLVGAPSFDDLVQLDGSPSGTANVVVDIGGLDVPGNRTAAVLASIALEGRHLGKRVELAGATDRHLEQLEALGMATMFGEPADPVA